MYFQYFLPIAQGWREDSWRSLGLSLHRLTRKLKKPINVCRVQMPCYCRAKLKLIGPAETRQQALLSSEVCFEHRFLKTVTAADTAGYELSSAWQEHAVWSQVTLLPCGMARSAVLSSRAEVNWGHSPVLHCASLLCIISRVISARAL